MAGGHKVDPGKLQATGKAYTQEKESLHEGAKKITVSLDSSTIGKAWQDSAEPYNEAIEKLRDQVKKYGEQTADFGGRLVDAGDSYSNGETVSAETIAQKGV